MKRDPVARELRSLRKWVERLASSTKAHDALAVKRSVAAKMMGIGTTKLDALIRSGELATAQDRTLVPLSEVRRYCAPKEPHRHKRRRSPVRLNSDDEALRLRDDLDREVAT